MSGSFKSLVWAIALVSALLFSLVAAGQYVFLTYQLHQRSRDDLESWAVEMRDDVAFDNSWNLQGYRRSTEAPDVYVVVSQNGTLIDTHGYLPGMLGRVSLPFRVDSDRPFKFSSDVGENWNLYVHRIRDGIVILGVRAVVTPENLQQRFTVSATRFGSNVADAVHTPEQAIDESFDWAVVDSKGTVRWAIGGIPMKSAEPQIPDSPIFAASRQISGSYYSNFVQSVKSKDGRRVGVISVFEDVSDEQRILHQAAQFNTLVAAALWIVTVGFAAVYLRHTRVPEITGAQIPLLQESDTAEFKSSLRWNYRAKMSDPELERVVAKTVAGFFNSYHGGNLIIGLDDQGNVLGLQPDYSTLGKKQNRDGFEQALRNVFVSAFGEEPCAAWTKVSFCTLQGKDLCILRITPATEPMYRKEKGSDSPRPVRVFPNLRFDGV